MKKIECEDENAARKAFQEAMALSELKHPNICGYKEFFVNWDKTASAMFVCIIMENYPNGDLSRNETTLSQSGRLSQLSEYY